MIGIDIPTNTNMSYYYLGLEYSAHASFSKPIPVTITQIGPRDFQASFVEAKMAMSGTDPTDAYESLVAFVLDAVEDLVKEEDNLGLGPREQLRVLRKYMVGL